MDTSFARGLRLLLVVADRGEVRADELATALAMPVSTVYRYLRTLAEFGLLDRKQGRYRLDARLHIETGPVVTSERLARASGPVLSDVARWSGETAVVMRRVGTAAVRLDQVEAAAPLRVSLDADAQTPLAAGAFGLVLLAYAPPGVLDELLAEPQGSTEAPLDPEVLRGRLRHVAREGWAVSSDEPVKGSVAVAVPILMADGIVGALGILGPAFRCDHAWLARARVRLPRAARSIARRLARGSAA
jgi:DNA-binding IclR family transcriptional regulator